MRWIRRFRRCATTGALLSILASSGLAAQTGTVETQALEQLPRRETESYLDRVRKEGQILDLSLHEAIRLALTNNLDLVIQNFNEDLNRESIRSVKGYYDPSLTFTVGWQSSQRPASSVLDAGGNVEVSENNGFTWNTSFNQNVPYGGSLRLTLNNNRSFTNSTFSTFNPSFGSNFSVEFTQPLWRGFIDTSTERQIKISSLDLEISDIQFERRVSEIVRLVQDRYWDLVQAISANEAERRSMNLAVTRFEDSQKRVEIGIEAPIEITSARSEVASREQSMIQSEVAIVDAENDLKDLLAPDPDAAIWNLRIVPTDKPQAKDIQVTLEQAIDMAYQRRPELKELEHEMEKIEVNRRFYKREGKPRVDLVYRYGSTGQAGQALIRQGVDLNGDGVPDVQQTVPDPSSPFNGGLFDSIGRSLQFDFTNYSVSANITIPLKNRANEASLAQQAINERRLLSQQRQTRQRISVDVRKAYRQIEIQNKRLEAARISRELAEERLDGENKRFEAGLSTNFEVLNIQRDLADAVIAELQAEILHVKSITALEQAMYTLIENSDIVLAKGSGQ